MTKLAEAGLPGGSEPKPPEHYRGFRALRTVKRIQTVVWRRVRLLLDLLFARRNTERRLRAATLHNVLIVCYGNIYRSPFLAAYLQSSLRSLIAVRSSGFHPVAARPSPEGHVEASARLGVRLQNHRSAIFTNEDSDWADLIVVMDRHNWDEVVRRGAPLHKVVWAGSLAGGKPEITDPYTLDESMRVAVLHRLVRAGDRLIAAVKQREI